MSFVKSLTEYVEAQTSLVIDTDLFVGAEEEDSPGEFVVITEMPGSGQNYSGLQTRAIQITVKALSLIAAETLAGTVFDLLAHKPGFPSGGLDENIFYCDVIGRPGFIDKDERGRFIYTANLLFKRA